MKHISDLGLMDFLKHIAPAISIENDKYTDRESPWADYLQTEELNPEEKLQKLELIEKVRDIFSVGFNKREQIVIKYRLGIGPEGECLTLNQVAEIAGISRETVRVTENQVIEKAKKRLLNLMNM